MPHPPTVLRLVSTLLVVGACASPAPREPGWTTLRGPATDGTYPGRGRFRASIAFEPAWTRDGGTGYSAITARDDTIVTQLSDGASNVLVALDAATGRERWRVPVGALRQGQGGAADGPLSTPVIDGRTIYALDPAGALVAVGLADGSRLWTVDLVRDLGGEAPPHGFATTPLPLDGVLIVQAGGTASGSTVGLDPRTGERLWSHGNDAVGYQSPIDVILAGKRQALVATNRSIFGLDPRTGSELWRLPLVREAADGIVHVSPAGPDRLLVQLAHGALLYDRDGSSWVERWRSTELVQSLAPALYRDGHLYGFRQGALVCLDAATGAVAWASDGIGARGMVLVDDTLLVFTSGGVVLAIRASPEGYAERGRIGTRLRDSYTWPTFDGERVYVRDLSRLAAVRVLPGEGD